MIQVAASTKKVSQDAETLATSINQNAASAEEMSRSTKVVAQSAEQLTARATTHESMVTERRPPRAAKYEAGASTRCVRPGKVDLRQPC